MSVSAIDVHQSVIQAACRCLDHCLSVIEHCVGQLTDDQIWWRPQEPLNSIGNLLLHLNGNLQQWMIAGLRGTADTRNRPSEFATRTPTPGATLVEQLQATIHEIKQTLSAIRPEEMLTPRRIQGFDVTGWEAVFDSIPHLKGHTQEIVCLTRQQLDNRYQFLWQPSSTEDGAAT